MRHPDEATLNQYLDETLTSRKRQATQKHVQSCSQCQAQLSAIGSVFRALDTLTDVKPDRDLSQGIVSRLQERQPARGWRCLVIIQAGFSLGMMLLLAKPIAQAFEVLFPSVLEPMYHYASLPGNYLEEMTAALKCPFTIPDPLALIPLDFQTSLMPVLALVGVLWIAGNAAYYFAVKRETIKQ